MKTFAIAFALLSSVSAFAASADLSISTRNFKLVDAEYKLIPTKVEYREIPGCREDGEASRECTETIVLETRPAVIANVSYDDSMFSSEGNQPNWLSLEIDIAELPASEVEKLKKAYPTWRHPFSRAGQKFAKNNLALSVVRAERTIQVVDVRNSKLCPILESGETYPGCVERLVYKDAKTTVNEVTVSVK